MMKPFTRCHYWRTGIKAFAFFIFLTASAVYSQNTLQYPHFHWRSTDSVESNALLNFNPAYYAEDESFVFPNLSFPRRDMTAIVVYRVSDSSEQALWELPLSDSSRVGLTTRRMLGAGNDLRYMDRSDPITIVHTLFRNWKSTEGLPESYDFHLLRADSLGFQGKIAECLIFDRHIDDTTLVQHISCLSVKYGITLFKTDYLSSSRSMYWDYSHYPNYSCSIGGLGRDDSLSLYQKQSCLLDEKVVIGLMDNDNEASSFPLILPLTNADNTATLEDGEYLMWGFDSSLLKHNGRIFLENGLEFDVYGNGLFQGTKEETAAGTGSASSHYGLPPQSPSSIRKTFMTVDASGWEGSAESYYLLIDRSGRGNFLPEDIEFYVPDFADSNKILHFSNIEWDTDRNGIDRFCFTYVPLDSLLEERNLAVNGGSGRRGNGCLMNDLRVNEQKDNDGSRRAGISYKLYPNPTSEYCYLEIHFPGHQDVVVKLYSPEGKLLDSRKGKNSSSYQFDYRLPVSGQYLMEIQSSLETKTMKAVKK